MCVCVCVSLCVCVCVCVCACTLFIQLSHPAHVLCCISSKLKLN